MGNPLDMGNRISFFLMFLGSPEAKWNFQEFLVGSDIRNPTWRVGLVQPVFIGIMLAKPCHKSAHVD